ncbi:MAG: polysaccharide biosynthesis/export family protein [Desulfosalsimonas sp.]
MNLNPHLAKSFFFGLVFAFFLAAAVYAQQQAPAEPEEYVIGAGDVLDISVYGEPEISRSVFVRIDGGISLPLAGEVTAAGKTPSALAEQITGKLSQYFEDPSVTVILSESRSKAYYILGQVQEPGEYAITRPVTVLQAVARAGGFAEWAKKDRIMIVSGPGSSGEITYFNYDRFLGGKTENKNVAISPGDTIVVP